MTQLDYSVPPPPAPPLHQYQTQGAGMRLKQYLQKLIPTVMETMAADLKAHPLGGMAQNYVINSLAKAHFTDEQAVEIIETLGGLIDEGYSQVLGVDVE